MTKPKVKTAALAPGMKKIIKKLETKRPGPKGLGLGPMVAINGRGTPAQHDKFLRLGGGAWLREQLDAAKMPKKR